RTTVSDPRNPNGDLPPELDPRAGRPPRRPSGDAERAAPPASSRPARPDRPAQQAPKQPVAPGVIPHRTAVGLKIIAAVASVAVLITSGALWGYWRNFNAHVNHLGSVPQNTSADIDGKDQNVLLVGDDSRAGLTDAQLKAVGTQQSDGF